MARLIITTTRGKLKVIRSLEDYKSDKDIIQIIDFLGRDIKQKNNIPLFYFYDDGSVEKKIIIE